MRWKLLLAVLVIVAIVSVIVFTGIGKDYLGFFSSAGQFVSTITGFSIFPSSAGNLLSISLEAAKGEFYGQNYAIKNSSIFITGEQRKILVGDQIISLKKAEPVSITIKNLDGEFAFLSDGSIKIDGKSNYIEIDDYSMQSEKPKQISVQILPSRMLVTNFAKDKIVFDSITGELKRFVKTNIDQISLTDNKLEIAGFIGFMKLDENGVVELAGLAASVKGKDFTFSAS